MENYDKKSHKVWFFEKCFSTKNTKKREEKEKTPTKREKIENPEENRRTEKKENKGEKRKISPERMILSNSKEDPEFYDHNGGQRS